MGDQFDGMDEGVKVALGFGGKTLAREEPLRIGDELYILMKCEIVSDGRSKKAEDNGELVYKAGASTTILAELSQSAAARIAADHG